MALKQHNGRPSLVRWYIDTRPLTSSTSSLPLLETLQPPDQETVRKYYQLPDRHMSLASNLLKYLFIHRTCRIPWKEIHISRTPAPHRRPCFVPPTSGHPENKVIPNVEFNVSHQASLVALAGTIYSPSDSSPEPVFTQPVPSSAPSPSVPQVGIDITCADEKRGSRASNPPTTHETLAEFVDIFAEVFSPRELRTMKNARGPTLPPGPQRNAAEVQYGLWMFYTYWALKEAYIKMTGEALLAPWLRELEFTDVLVPEVSDVKRQWSRPYTGVRTWLRGELVEDVRVEIVAFGREYLIATAVRGAGIGAGSRILHGVESVDPWESLVKVDIEKDITACAIGSCHCLE